MSTDRKKGIMLIGAITFAYVQNNSALKASDTIKIKMI